MSPEEGKQVTAIERFLGRSIPRVTLPDFDYKARPTDERRYEERGSTGGGARRGRPDARGDGRPGRYGGGRPFGGASRGGGGASHATGGARPGGGGRHGSPGGDARRSRQEPRSGHTSRDAGDSGSGSLGRRRRKVTPAERHRRGR